MYCAAVAGGLFLIYTLHVASPFSAFLVMGAAALISSGVLLLRLKPIWHGSFTHPNWRTVSSEHWQYGRWVLASLVLNAVAGDIYYPLVSSFSGEAAAGELKALMNFFMLVAQTFSALSFFFLPYASRVWQESGLAGLNRVTWRIAWVFGGLSVAYWAVLIALRIPLLQFVYGGRYTSLAHLVPWVAAASLPWNIAVAPAIALRAVRTSSSIFLMYCASSAVAVVVGVPATWAFKLPGALVAMCVSNMAALAVALVLVSHELNRNSE
jgi:O-antigen/teichoic acid export membrane protein